uniref:Axonemal dynein light intermediate polypeptide 1 n=1 Tax=Maylandia zebra TaxID=106582 RepID=A0A3P9BMT0_9CICH
PADTLLKYDNPVLVNKSTDRKSPKGRPLKVSPQQPIDSTPVPPPPKPKSASTEATKQENEELLNSILPPREWMEGNQLWVQKVSSTPCTRADVLHLEELLNTKLQQRQAKETGICPVRRELYSQCFDELLRQVTINCAERGMLLWLVRDEIQMTIAAYQTVYESSIAYGMRKHCRLRRRKNEKQELKKALNEEKAKCETVEKIEAEKRQLEEKRHDDEIQFLKRTNQQLKVTFSITYQRIILVDCVV